MMRLLQTLALTGALLTAACAGDSTTGPSSNTIAGSWTGTVASQVSGSGRVQVTFSQNGGAISGTWAATFPNAAANDAGTVSGQLNGSSLQALLNPGSPSSCPYNVTATVSNTSIAGTYTTVNCSIAVGGTINLTR